MSFINQAYADAAAAAPAAQQGLAGMTPFLLIMVVIYFFMIRPQVKRQQQHTQMVKSLERGAKVITSGGIVATVVKVDNEAGRVVAEIADGEKVQLLANTITQVLAKEAAEPKAKTESAAKVTKKKPPAKKVEASEAKAK